MAAAPSGGVVRFAVELSSYANEYLERLKGLAHRRDGSRKFGSRELAAYDGVVNVLEKLIPEHALAPRFSLGNRQSGNLSGIFRSRVGRLRVFWIASPSKARAIVLAIGFRREGDRNDAYEYLGKLLRGGYLDHHFDDLGGRTAFD